MSAKDKFDNKAQELKGKADQAAAGTKQAGEKLKDTAKDVTDRR